MLATIEIFRHGWRLQPGVRLSLASKPLRSRSGWSILHLHPRTGRAYWSRALRAYSGRGRTHLSKQPLSRRTEEPASSAPSEQVLRQRVLEALDELKARDVREIDVRGKTSIADLLIIASGTSTRHVKSIADEVVKFVKRAGMLPLGVEGETEAEWVLVDLGDIIVHVMLPRIREFYGLERLWTVGDHDAAAANE